MFGLTIPYWSEPGYRQKNRIVARLTHCVTHWILWSPSHNSGQSSGTGLQAVSAWAVQCWLSSSAFFSVDDHTWLFLIWRSIRTPPTRSIKLISYGLDQAIPIIFGSFSGSKLWIDFGAIRCWMRWVPWSGLGPPPPTDRSSLFHPPWSSTSIPPTPGLTGPSWTLDTLLLRFGAVLLFSFSLAREEKSENWPPPSAACWARMNVVEVWWGSSMGSAWQETTNFHDVPWPRQIFLG